MMHLTKNPPRGFQNAVGDIVIIFIELPHAYFDSL